MNPVSDPIRITCKAHDFLPIDAILEFQGGLKKLSKANREKLQKSILREGFMAPFFVWDDKGDYRLLDGHQRLSTLLYMREQGWDIPLLPYDVIQADNEQEARRKLLGITSQYGEFENEELLNWIDGLDSEVAETIRLVDTEIEFDIPEETEETQGDDDVEEDVDPVTKLGDLWELGEHRLLCGDSTKKEDIEILMNGIDPDLIQTDPPYGMNAVTKSGVLSEKYKNDIMGDDSPDIAKQSFSLALSMFPKAKQIWWGANYYCSVLPDSECWLVWDKNNGESDQTDCELAWANFRSVVRQFTMASEKKNRVHPTQKPVELIEWIFKRFKFSSDTIADFFGGSGVTVISAEKNGKKSYIMELDPHYCDVIVNRYKTWMEQNGRECVIKLNGGVWNG